MRRLIVLSAAALAAGSTVPAKAEITPQVRSATVVTTTTTTVPPAQAQVDFDAELESAQQDAKTDFNDTSGHVLTDFKNNLYKGVRETRDWLLTPPPKAYPQPVASTYCYTVFQDILCYRQPMPGWEHKLVAYQGTHAAPPPPAVMKLMPMRPEETTTTVATRVNDTKPVFNGIPVDVKAEAAAEQQAAQQPGAPTMIDTSHETLPNPAFAPQM